MLLILKDQNARSLSATFQRIYEHYGINIDPTKKNLELLQQKKFKIKKKFKRKNL